MQSFDVTEQNTWRKLTQNEFSHLINIVLSHNPDDPCQNVVLSTAIDWLIGTKELPGNSCSVLLLTNGASGYNPDMCHSGLEQDMIDSIIAVARDVHGL